MDVHDTHPFQLRTKPRVTFVTSEMSDLECGGVSAHCHDNVGNAHGGSGVHGCGRIVVDFLVGATWNPLSSWHIVF